MLLPEPDATERNCRKSMQWLLQEHKRRLDEDRAQKRARTLPSLARLPLGVRVTPVTAAPTLKA
eukprot:5663285-Pyramimonas_sp.AAC.1